MLKAQYVFRPNTLHKPFDNPKIRHALWYAFNQEDFLMATIGDENYIKAVQGAVHLRHAAGHDQGNGRPSDLQLRRRRRSC